MFTGWVYFRIMDIFSRLYGDRDRGGGGKEKRMRLVNDKENDDAS